MTALLRIWSILGATLIAGILMSAVSHAEKTIDIYTTDELVINQTAEVRRKAATKGLASVLVRLSGSRDVLQAPTIRKALKKATIYLYEYRYRATDQTLTIAGASQPASRLIMRFSQSSLETLLRNAQLPIWSLNRPDVLVWTAINKKGKRYVSKKSAMGRALKKAAVNRGLPITNPVLDLEDRSALPLARLWAMDEGSVRVASRRYDADAVLSGRFSQDRKQWVGNFILLHRGKTTYYTASGTSQSRVAQSVVNQVTDFFANIYAVVPNAADDSRSISLQINNVLNFTDYAKVLNYIEKLPTVRSVTLSKIDKQQLLVRIALNSNIDRFFSALELDRKLKRVDQNTSTTIPPGVSFSLGQDGTTTTSQLNTVVDKPYEFLWRR